MKLTLISGMSGSGKSTAIKTLEDLGYYCIDNIPLTVLPRLIRWYKEEFNDDLLAVGMDTRTQGSFDHIDDYLEELEKDGVNAHIMFLDAQDDILIRRFSETRRKHPLANGNDATLKEALEEERSLLFPIKNRAYSLDTSRFNTYELREEVLKWCQKTSGKNKNSINITLVSFGYKYGLPNDLDFVFDVRNLPNPYWYAELRHLSGQSSEVKEFFQKSSETQELLEDFTSFIKRRIKGFKEGTRSYLSFGIGCTGGFHRSVYIADTIAKELQSEYIVVVRHRDLYRQSHK